ncbi:hypothetical protein FXE86_12440 [Vibrio mimicus]|nr:hypothetical protein FXE86_12440 [Vibrio mimicus]
MKLHKKKLRLLCRMNRQFLVFSSMFSCALKNKVSHTQYQIGAHCLHAYNKRLKRDCQRAAFPVPMSRGGYGCCV